MSVRRYQLACAILAATTVASITVAHQRGPHAAAGIQAPAAGASRNVADRWRRPVRVAASALGISEAELIDRLLAAPTAREVAIYAEKLGVVGTNDAVIAMTPLIDDPRAGIPEAVIAAIGRIGTRHATELILKLVEDTRPRVRSAAVGALGGSADERALAVLTAIAEDRGDPARLTAIWALGEQGGDDAMALLVTIARTGDATAAQSAVSALASIPGAQEALLALTEVPNLQVRIAALSALDPSTPGAIARLTAVIAAGELQTSQAALGALGRSTDPAVVPVLARATAAGNSSLRWAAIAALGEHGGAEAIEVLGDLLAHAELDVTGQLAATLANLGDDEARAKLIEVALEGGRRGALVLSALGNLRGDDVRAALLAIAKDGSPSARREALPFLMRTGAPEALVIAADMVRTGGRADRLAAIQMLGDAPGDEARATLLDLAEREHGPTRTAALEALSQRRPDDPALTPLLGAALLTGRPDEVASAAAILGRIGTSEAHALLVAAIGDDDVGRAQAALGALGYGVAVNDELRAALVAAATTGVGPLRLQATQQLLTAGGPEGVAAARALIGSGDGEAARQALWALGNVGSDGAAAIIRESAASSDAQVRATAAGVMAQHPDEADAALLIGLARDQDYAVRVQALATLGTLGSAAAIDTLLQAASTSAGAEPGVQQAAISALGSADDPRASASLARLIEDRDSAAAVAAIYASGNGGDDVDQALLRAFRSAGENDPRRYAAATQLRQRGLGLDDATAREVEALVGAEYGGYGYGGRVYYGE